MIHNTLTAFVAYGAPNARCRVADRSAQSTPRTRRLTQPARPSVLDAVRRRMSGDDDGSDGSPLTAARARLRGRLTPGSWRALTEGQVALAQATSRFDPRQRAEIGLALARLLDRTDAPPQVRELRYRAGQDERTALFAEERRGPIQRRVALVLDAHGAVITEAASR